MKKQTLSKNKEIILITVQVLIIVLSGILVRDEFYRIIISAAGIAFNFLVCSGKRFGFVVGMLYAVSYGIMSYFDEIYASCVFMLLIQFPSAIISFITWNKQEDNSVKMQRVSSLKRICIALAFIFSVIIAYMLLKYVNGSGAVFDAFFFSASFISCILLAIKKKEACFVILLSGLAGTVLWSYQFLQNGTGLSVLLLNFFVLLNSVRGLIGNIKTPILKQ